MDTRYTANELTGYVLSSYCRVSKPNRRSFK
jgi:hypothetical protein